MPLFETEEKQVVMVQPPLECQPGQPNQRVVHAANDSPALFHPRLNSADHHRHQSSCCYEGNREIEEHGMSPPSDVLLSDDVNQYLCGAGQKERAGNPTKQMRPGRLPFARAPAATAVG